MCCTEHCTTVQVPLQGRGSSIQGTLERPARLSVLPGQMPWEGFHTNSSKAKAEQVMDEISPVRSVAVRASLDGGFCSSAAAASCLVSKDRGSDKSWEEAGGSAMKLFPLGGGCAAGKRRIQADKG